jgi:proton-dependent oligopeptide transporter, POT family
VERRVSTKHNYKQPWGIWYIGSVSGVMSIGFGLINSLFVLYATQKLGLSQSHAYNLYASYNAMLFALPIIGGYTASKLGFKKALSFGAALLIIGLLILTQQKIELFYVGLSFYASGIAFFVPSYLVLQSKLYSRNDDRRESGFTLSYVIMNMGFLIASVLGGYLSKHFSFQACFYTGAATTFLLLFYIMLGLPHIKAEASRSIVPTSGWSMSACLISLLLIAVLIMGPICFVTLSFASIGNAVLIAFMAMVFAIIVFYALRQKPEDKRKLIAFVILAILSIGFWALYTLEPSLLTLFIKNSVDRTFFGATIPPSTFYGLDPFFILVLGSLFAWLWVRLRRKQKDPTLPTKFALSLFSMTAGFGCLALLLHVFGLAHKLSSFWVIFAYIFLTIGELLIGPIGQSMVGRLSPDRLEGVLMGTWQMTTGAAAAISGYLANWGAIPKAAHTLASQNAVYSHAFIKISATTLVMGLIALILIPVIKKTIR